MYEIILFDLTILFLEIYPTNTSVPIRNDFYKFIHYWIVFNLKDWKQF